MRLRPAEPGDFQAILRLNEESVSFLSPLSRDRLTELHAQAAVHVVAEQQGELMGFVLALRERSAYDSVNYQWFAARFETFLYVDRVVVARSAHGQGVGKLLYEQVFLAARQAGVGMVTCEYDIEPPNPASAAFHQRFGFKEVGRQSVARGKKLVSLQRAELDAGAVDSGQATT